MFCWKAVDDVQFGVDGEEGLEEMEGAPMSVQQVFTELIGREELTLEKYQVRCLSLFVRRTSCS